MQQPQAPAVHVASLAPLAYAPHTTAEENLQLELALAHSCCVLERERGSGGPGDVPTASSSQRSPHRRGSAEALSLKYWKEQCLDFTDQVPDGFYDVYGDFPEVVEGNEFPSLRDLETGLVRQFDDDPREVVLVDHQQDRVLVAFEETAGEAMAAAKADDTVGRIKALASAVADQFGGVYDTDEALNHFWLHASAEERRKTRSAVVLLGRLNVGSTRHRALLFKMLADASRIPCKLICGRRLCGADSCAMNVVVVGGQQLYVDLVHQPGQLLSCAEFQAVVSERLQRPSSWQRGGPDLAAAAAAAQPQTIWRQAAPATQALPAYLGNGAAVASSSLSTAANTSPRAASAGQHRSSFGASSGAPAAASSGPYAGHTGNGIPIGGKGVRYNIAIRSEQPAHSAPGPPVLPMPKVTYVTAPHAPSVLDRRPQHHQPLQSKARSAGSLSEQGDGDGSVGASASCMPDLIRLEPDLIRFDSGPLPEPPVPAVVASPTVTQPGHPQSHKRQQSLDPVTGWVKFSGSFGQGRAADNDLVVAAAAAVGAAAAAGPHMLGAPNGSLGSDGPAPSRESSGTVGVRQDTAASASPFAAYQLSAAPSATTVSAFPSSAASGSQRHNVPTHGRVASQGSDPLPQPHTGQAQPGIDPGPSSGPLPAASELASVMQRHHPTTASTTSVCSSPFAATAAMPAAAAQPGAMHGLMPQQAVGLGQVNGGAQHAGGQMPRTPASATGAGGYSPSPYTPATSVGGASVGTAPNYTAGSTGPADSRGRAASSTSTTPFNSHLSSPYSTPGVGVAADGASPFGNSNLSPFGGTDASGRGRKPEKGDEPAAGFFADLSPFPSKASSASAGGAPRDDGRGGASSRGNSQTGAGPNVDAADGVARSRVPHGGSLAAGGVRPPMASLPLDPLSLGGAAAAAGHGLGAAAAGGIGGRPIGQGLGLGPGAGLQPQQQPHMHGAQPQQQQAQQQQAAMYAAYAAMHGSPYAAALYHQQPDVLPAFLQMGQSAVGSAAALDWRNYGVQQPHMHQQQHQQHQQQQHQQQRWVPSWGEQAPHAPSLVPWQAAGSLVPWQSLGQNPGLLGSAVAGAHAAAAAAAGGVGAGTAAGAQPALLRPPPAAPSLAQAQAAAPAAPALLPQQPQPASPTAAAASNAEAAPANPPPPPLEPAMSHTLPPSHRDFEIDPSELTQGPCIGTGSYGEVFKGTWRGTEVAIKRFKILEQNLSANTIKEFRDEVSIMSKLRHPNIVLFMGAVAQPSQLAIVTQFVPRGSLFRLLHGSRKVELDPRRRLSMAMDIAKGMEYLHNCKPMLVHRDLKSPNLLVDRDWTVKVCDFGLTRVMGGSFMTARTSGGTPEWMAPEVLRGERSDEKSDVWSYGVILYELVTGTAPWRDLRQEQVVGVVGFGNQRLALPNDLDAPVVKLVEACWAATPQERPSFTQVLAALNQLKELRPSAAAAAEEEARR